MVKKITSLGLFILDTFEYRSAEGIELSTIPLPTDREEIGGGGLYALLGARIWSPADKVGLLVDRGTDWKESVQKQLDVYGDMFVYREKEGLTTRALNLYTGNHRDFKYLTPRTRLEPIDLPPSLLTSTWLHFVCSPTRALVIISQLSSSSTLDFSPNLCFEPIPDRCVPEELESLKKVLKFLAVFSPNHEEALSLLGRSKEYLEEDMTVDDRKRLIENVTDQFLNFGITKENLVVIRCGALGSYTKRQGEEKGYWIEAYHTDIKKVIDVTGCGNMFLGGLMAGLESDPKDDKLACMKASVSASYCLEQFGLPKLTTSLEGKEFWNQIPPETRLEEMKQRHNYQ